jgi:hypothetical protein
MFVPSLLDDGKSSASLLKKKYNHRARLFQRFQPILKEEKCRKEEGSEGELSSTMENLLRQKARRTGRRKLT